MKKKVLAALLAVCMILSTCVLYASAATFAAANTYVRKISEDGDFSVSNLEVVEINKSIQITAKDTIKLSTGTKTVTADNVDEILDFKSGSSTYYYSAKEPKLKNYFKVSGTVDPETGKITVEITEESANILSVYRVGATAIDGDDTVEAVEGKLVSTTPTAAKKYVPNAYTVKTEVTEWVNKLASLTMGVRFFGKTYDNLVASEIAVVTATVERVSGASVKTTSSVTNKIEDLMIGDKVTLKASLKDPAEKDFYGFNCWVDGSGNVVSTDEAITVTMDGNSVAYYAAFVELKSRVTIDYSSTGNGKVVYEEGREVFSGDAQISVLVDREATFTFVPDEGYEVAHVKVDGKDVASFLSIVDSTDLLDALKVLIAATDKDNYSYTFTAEQLKEVNGNHTIEVEFQKVKVLEEPSGKDLPTVAAEGITLATGADAENGDSENGATTVPAEDGAAANGGSAASGVVNPATGSTGAIAVFATLSVAACAAFVTAKKKKED